MCVTTYPESQLRVRMQLLLLYQLYPVLLVRPLNLQELWVAEKYGRWPTWNRPVIQNYRLTWGFHKEGLLFID